MGKNLGGHFALAGNLLPIRVGDDHRLGGHVSFGDPAGRTHERAIIEAGADIAVVRGDEALVIDAPADFAHGFA